MRTQKTYQKFNFVIMEENTPQITGIAQEESHKLQSGHQTRYRIKPENIFNKILPESKCLEKELKNRK